MVRGVNRVILMGNLATDPELRYTPQGTPVASFRLAVNRGYRTADGGMKEEVSFFTVVTWNKTAETATQYLAKGRPVLVEGRLSIRDYEKEGEKRYVTEIIAGRVVFLGAGGSPAGETHEEVPDDVPFY